MAATNIGTGAIVLTANADQALAGFEKVSKGATKLSKSIDINNGTAGYGKLNRMLFGTAEHDSDTGEYVGRVGGIFGKLHSMLTPGVGGRGWFNRLLFGTPENDGKTGEYLGRIGGIFNQTKGVADKAGKKAAGGFGTALAAGLGGLAGGALGALGGILAGPLAELANPSAILHGIKSISEELSQKVQTNGAANSLTAIVVAVDRIDMAVDQLTIRFLSALAPAVTTVSNVVLAALDRWSGEFDKIAAGFGAATYAATEMFGAILGQILGLTDSTGSWATSTQDAQHKIFDGAKSVAEGFAAVWDAAREGASVTLNVFSKIVFGLNVVITALGETRKAFVDAFGGDTGFKIAGVLGGAGVGFLAGGPFGALLGGGIGYAGASAIGGIDTDKTTTNLAAMSDGLSRLGDRLDKAGNSVRFVDGVFAGMEDRFRLAQKNISDMGSMVPTKLAGAFDVNSKDAYSIVAQYQGNGQNLANLQQQQIKAIEKGNEILNGIRNDAKKKEDAAFLKFGAI